ncbi:MAG: aminotransferase class V-fold PLP-dependent enzyme [Proteobacteria bacterium]|nr:aminotransferase class V-fold PLP-dependent enzyme [Pseudomonadota bacterium]MCL2307792.1 aminotransferase class V-fold PLP-dependent enzyme [Pseudomonadota bacterium]
MAEINFLPGPVKISPRVKAALGAKTLSHRSDAFSSLHEQCKEALLRLGKSKHVAMLMGSGTAANAVVAQELKKLSAKGLILSNGEFGTRLIHQGRKAGLDFDSYVLSWGEAFAFEEIKKRLQGKSWLWLTHCETATGALNLDERLVAYCKERNIKLCLDSVSAFGNQETDFSGAYLASSSSGKGLCAFSGIALVFYNHEPEHARSGMDYLDLAVYQEAATVPFTFSSNLLNALHTALLTTDYRKKFAQNTKHASRITECLAANGLHTPLNERQADYLWTIAIPEKIPSSALGARLEKEGVLFHYRNRYLLENNWIQMALMGVFRAKEVVAGLGALERGLQALLRDGGG